MPSRAYCAWTHPSRAGALRSALRVRSADVQERDISTVFYPVWLESAAETLSVRIQGRFVTLLGEQRVDEEARLYELRFVWEQGRLWLMSVREREAVQSS